MSHDFFMKKAIMLAEDALKNNEFPVGALIVNDEKIIAQSRRIKSFDETCHAEMQVLSDFYKLNIEDRSKVTIYSTLEPCLMCFGAILISGIGTLVYSYEDAMGGASKINLERMNPLYKSSKLNVIPHILRDESLSLFKKFFSDPDNNYWKESYLEKYTLDQ